MGACVSAPLPVCDGGSTKYVKRGRGFRVGGILGKSTSSEPSRVCPSASPDSIILGNPDAANYLVTPPPRSRPFQQRPINQGGMLPGSGPPSMGGSAELEAADVFVMDPLGQDAHGGQLCTSSKKLEEAVTVFGKGVATLKGRNGVAEERQALLERHNVQIRGTGQELLVFSHSFGTTQEMWEGLLDAFDLTQYRIVLYDLAGSDSTNLDSFDFQRYSTLHGYADDLLEILTELGVEPDWGEPCIFVGYGVSCMIGVIAAVERPRSFKRLLLIGASPKYLNAADYRGGFDLSQLDNAFAAAQENYKMWISGLPPRVDPEDIEPKRVREFVEPIFFMRPDISLCLLKTLFTCDVRETLPKVGVQCHLLHMSHDVAVKWSTVQYMLDNIPNAYAEMLPGDDEDPLAVNVEVIADAIVRHLHIPVRTSFARKSSQRLSLHRFPSFHSRTDSMDSLALSNSELKLESVT